MKIVVVRERDLETFELSAFPVGGYVLDPSSDIPGSTALDVTGYEYSGRDGGYNTSSRLQRRAYSLSLKVREDYTTTLGLFELIFQAQRFFDPHNDDLTSNLYTLEFYTNDRTQSSFMLRHGTISVPFGAKTLVGEHIADAQISFIFGDPYLYPIGDSGLSVQLYAGGQDDTISGRMWDATNGATWSGTLGKLWLTSGTGGNGDPLTIDVSTVATVPVSIVTSGQLINPTITNLTNGSSFQYNGTLEATDVLTVDTTGLALLNGYPPAYTYSGTLTAQDGNNTFVMSAVGGSPGYVTLSIMGAF